MTIHGVECEPLPPEAQADLKALAEEWGKEWDRPSGGLIPTRMMPLPEENRTRARLDALEGRVKELEAALGTERTMHKAWRKRAEEAEAREGYSNSGSVPGGQP